MGSLLYIAFPDEDDFALPKLTPEEQEKYKGFWRRFRSTSSCTIVDDGADDEGLTYCEVCEQSFDARRLLDSDGNCPDCASALKLNPRPEPANTKPEPSAASQQVCSGQPSGPVSTAGAHLSKLAAELAVQQQAVSPAPLSTLLPEQTRAVPQQAVSPARLHTLALAEQTRAVPQQAGSPAPLSTLAPAEQTCAVPQQAVSPAPFSTLAPAEQTRAVSAEQTRLNLEGLIHLLLAAKDARQGSSSSGEQAATSEKPGIDAKASQQAVPGLLPVQNLPPPPPASPSPPENKPASLPAMASAPQPPDTAMPSGPVPCTLPLQRMNSSTHPKEWGTYRRFCESNPQATELCKAWSILGCFGSLCNYVTVIV